MPIPNPMPNTTPSPPSPQFWEKNTYAKHGRFVAENAEKIITWLNPQKGEKILDAGCGDGFLTEKIAAANTITIGVDTSKSLLNGAKERGIKICRADVCALPFNNCFDAVFSNATLHWVNQPETAIKNIFKALKKDGRLVAEFGGKGNLNTIITALRTIAKHYNVPQDTAGPWFFPSPQYYQKLLEKNGFHIKQIECTPRPTEIKSGMQEWLLLFRKPFFEQFGNKKEDAINETLTLLQPKLQNGKGQFFADYVRLRVEAYK